MARIEFDNIGKTFGPTAALQEITVCVEEGEFLVIVGPSGCGKSTLLRIAAGLEKPDSGRILIDGVDVTARPPKDRSVAMVFQSYALYPHWTVRGNIAFPLKIRRVPGVELESRVRAIADSLQLTPQLDKRPKELSGGQRQRVALGRAMAANPKIFLFDEPLSNLDAPLRAEMRREIVTRQKAAAKTSLYVTHDQTEALTMADRIVVLDSGRIMGIGTPKELYDDPPNRFVAQFLGRPPINLLRTTFGGGGSVALDAVGLPGEVRLAEPVKSSQQLEIGIRPEHVALSDQGEDRDWRIESHEFLGDKMFYSLMSDQFRISALADAHSRYETGALVSVRPVLGRILVFDAATGRRFEHTSLRHA